MESQKRVRTLSKHGNIYYKNSDEYNRRAQRIHYEKCRHQIRANRILQTVEQGMCPGMGSIRKYPDELTEEAIMQRFRLFKENCTDAEEYLTRSKRLVNLFSKMQER